MPPYPTPPPYQGQIVTVEFPLPNNSQWRAYVLNALQPLTKTWYWESNPNGLDVLRTAQIYSEAFSFLVPKAD